MDRWKGGAFIYNWLAINEEQSVTGLYSLYGPSLQLYTLEKCIDGYCFTFYWSRYTAVHQMEPRMVSFSFTS